MLVLQRNESEWIDVTLPDGRVIGVQLVRSFDRKAKIGVQAPPDVRIDRRETTLKRSAGAVKDRGEAADAPAAT